MKNILIIGASKGIGLEAATLATQAGMTVYTASRTSTPALEALQTQHSLLDVANDDCSTLPLPSQLHALIFCPGSITLKPFNRLQPADYLADYQQNVIGAVKIIQQALPALKQADGGASIVLFSTVAAKLGMGFHASIAAAKGAVEAFAKSLAAELAPQNIRVNCIAPSLTNTSLAAALLNTPEKLEASNKRHPLGRIGTAQEVAQTALYLCSDAASWITGQVLGVDGGMGSLK
jgi:3-oxoacyl-[acyl-carrier protein] reductase